MAVGRGWRPRSWHSGRCGDAVSFLDTAAGAVEADPLAEGLQVADAEELAATANVDPFASGRLGIDPTRPLLVGQLYNRELASATKSLSHASIRTNM